MKKFFKDNINKIAVVIIALNLFIYTLLSTTAYADDFVDKPVVTTPSTDLSVVMSPVIGPQQLTAEIFSKAADDLILWETDKLNDILNEQIGADDVLKDYYEVYYDLLVNDYQNIVEKYCAGGSKFNSDGSFVTEYTNAYYRHYFKALYQFSEPFDWDLFIEYANERHKSETSGSSTDTSDYIKRKGGKPQFSSPAFKKYIEKSNKHYSPKNCKQYISFRTSEYSPRIILYSSGVYPNCFFEQGWRDGCYYTPFFYDGTDYYYTPYLYHDYLKLNDEGVTEYHSDVENKSEPNLGLSERVWTSQYLYSTSYISIIPFVSTSSNYYAVFTSYSNFLNNSGWQFGGNNVFGSALNAYSYYIDGDMTTSPVYPLYDFCKLTPSAFDEKYPQFADCDVGFFISNEPIEFQYTLDTEKIPDTYYITVSGDTIYDYSITNPDTGQSSTINEYITNNYTYITNNNPSGDGSGSGTTGGNVTVGGNVGVNGTVNVGGEVKFGGEVNVGVDVSPIDINVNVSGNGGAGESGGEPPEIGGLDDLVGYLPEKSPVISQYLKIFFDTLPPELLALILAGVAVAVIKLIFRR